MTRLTHPARWPGLLAGALPLAVAVFLAATGAGIYGWTLAAAAVACAGGAFLLAARREPPTQPSQPLHGIPVRPLSSRGRWPFYALAVLLWLGLLTVPLPPGLARLTGARRQAEHFTVERRFAQLEAAGVASPPARPWFSITRNRAGSLRVIASVTACLGVVVLVSSLGATGKRRVFHSLLAGGVVVAVAGFLSQWVIPAGDTLWWVHSIPHALPGPAACFINRNHYGGFTAVLTVAAAAMTVQELAAGRRAAAVWTAGASVLLGLATVLSLSRGGTIALAGGLLFALLLLLVSGHRTTVLGILLITLALGLGATRIKAPLVRERFAELTRPLQVVSLRTRQEVWKESLGIWRAYPLLGAGPNAFRMVYPQHRVTTGRAFRTHAENQYVELLTDTGLLGVGLAGCGVLLLLRLYRGAGREPGPAAHLIPVSLASLCVAGIHAAVDFPLYVPLYALTLSILAALGLPPLLAQGPRHWMRLALGVNLAAALAVAAVAGPMGRRDTTSYLYQAPLPDLLKAITWAPTDAHAWQYAGMRLVHMEGNAAAQRLGERLLSQAAAWNPNQYPLWLALGNVRLALGDVEAAREAFRRVRELRTWVKLPDLPGGAP